MPNKGLGYKTPYEALYNREPNIDHLKTIGCLVYATNTQTKDKLCPRAIPSVLLGYFETQNWYRLFNLQEKRIYVSCDLQFLEDVFPFKKESNNEFSIFPHKQSSEYDFIEIEVNSETSSLLEANTNNENHQSILFPTADSNTNSATPRRSSRTVKPPIWHKDYVLNAKTNACKYPINGHLWSFIPTISVFLD